jgi:hypothetical protein
LSQDVVNTLISTTAIADKIKMFLFIFFIIFIVKNTPITF